MSVVLSPIVVQASRFGTAYSQFAAAQPKPKPAPRRRAPRRRPPPKRPDRRPERRREAPPARRKSVPPVRKKPGVLKHLFRVARKGTPYGRIYDIADITTPYLVRGLERLLGGPIVGPPSRTYGPPPFVVGPPLPSLSGSPVLSPVIVSAPRATPTGIAQAFVGTPSPRTQTTQRPKTASARRAARPPRRPLTGLQSRALDSAKSALGRLELTDRAPAPQEELDRDPCKEKRRRERKKCPDRGYRRVCTAWRKQPCQ